VYLRPVAHNNLLFLFVALFFYWRYSEFAYSQGGAKFPTGGKSADAESPRALLAARPKVSRSGVIPEPTVRVRMGESNDICRAVPGARYFLSLHDTPQDRPDSGNPYT